MRRRSDEHRRAPRFRIALPVRFEDGDIGESRDVSAVGIFVHTTSLRAPSASVRLSVALGEWDVDGGFRIEGQARVVRVDTTGPRPGLGLDVVWSDIDPSGPRVPEARPAGSC